MRGKGFICLHRYGLVYARIPKAANTSIKESLAALVTDIQPNSSLRPTNDKYWKSSVAQAGFLAPDEYTSQYHKLFSFSFIRDPLDRLYSCYYDKIISNKCRSRSFQALGYSDSMSFDDFAAHTLQLDIHEMDVHTQPQTFLIEDSSGRLPKFIGLTESSNEHWSSLSRHCNRIGIPLKQSLAEIHVKSTKRGEAEPQLRNATLEDFNLVYGRDILLHKKITNNNQLYRENSEYELT